MTSEYPFDIHDTDLLKDVAGKSGTVVCPKATLDSSKLLIYIPLT
ncbi:MAG TPA: hypothetical protein VFF82_13625 [Rhodocyclaceae bacterium]|nr:hypothetical protein [Rhodocyclaceae bacterium]